MDRAHAEALSAFFDREPVDPELLAESLALPGAAALLAEFAAMRAHEQRERSVPTPEFFDRMAALLRPSRGGRLLGSRFAVSALAASLLIAAGAGGFALGNARAGRGREAASGGVPPSGTAPGRPPAIPATHPPALTGDQSTTQGGSDRAGPPLSTRRVELDRWQDTSASVAFEAQR